MLRRVFPVWDSEPLLYTAAKGANSSLRLLLEFKLYSVNFVCEVKLLSSVKIL